jgi:hypothetical protein
MHSLSYDEERQYDSTIDSLRHKLKLAESRIAELEAALETVPHVGWCYKLTGTPNCHRCNVDKALRGEGK